MNQRDTTDTARRRWAGVHEPLQRYRASGLISYSVDTDSLHKQAGIYAGRILKGEGSQ